MTITITGQRVERDDRAATFDSLDPATGEVVGRHPVHDAAAVNAAVESARPAFDFWSSLSFAQRARRLNGWAAVLTRRIDELAGVMHAEVGKPRSDARLEVMMAVEHIAWAATHAGKVLGARRVRSGAFSFNYASSVEYQPMGVVGVIGPWNFPVYTPMGSLAYALAAGNAVVFKPSEYSPGVGAWLVDAFAEVVPEAPVLQLITGFGDTGQALCRAGVDKIAFTGSAATGKRVLHACADGLVPAVIEGGGKDALLVDEDADVAAAAAAAVWGGFMNAGQTCLGVERVYVHRAVYDDFIEQVIELSSGLRAGPGQKIGPMTMPTQVGVVREHIEDALSRGGTAVIGGVDAVGERFIQPTVLIGVPEDSIAVREETFGPTLTVAVVPGMDEAIRLANSSSFGLGAAVYSRRRGAELAHKLHCGVVSVNSIIAFTGIPALPMGGVKQSGFGRIHGADGLREFSSSKGIARLRFAGPLAIATFARTSATDRLMLAATKVMRGRRRSDPSSSR